MYLLQSKVTPDSRTASQQTRIAIVAGLCLQRAVAALCDRAGAQSWSDLKRVTRALCHAVQRTLHSKVRRQENRSPVSKKSLKASAAQFS